MRPLALVFATLLLAAACRSGHPDDRRITVTFSGSALGAEGELLTRHVARFEQANPGIHVRIQRTPDDATQRHQLFVQWLNARAGEPDILQLDVVWTPEFAAAGWLLPLDRWKPNASAFFPSTIAANTWAGSLYAVPWYMDVGMLYWRTDLFASAPATMDELAADARRAHSKAVPYGIVWQSARYEGLVTSFVEFLGAFGGRILTEDGRVVVDSPEGIHALTFMRDLITSGAAPSDVLTWHEEESRFAFQNGAAAMMRNWPYAVTLLKQPRDSRVAGKFAVAPMPGAAGGAPTATLGGGALAINAFTTHPDAAWKVVEFFTAPEQILDRSRLSGYPPRAALYDDPRLGEILPIPLALARSIVERAVPRPATPIYSQLSELLQIDLHRALSGQVTPDRALHDAARAMNALIERTRIRELVAGRGARGAGR
jgi:ABC-type glycerol-3-phosphate transport system substrate-binding protein